MSIIGSFNGTNIIGLPCDVLSGVTHPSSIEWDAQEVVSTSISPFTGQVQVYDFQNSWWEAQVSFPPMNRNAIDAWSSFILECRGQSNFFQLGDPKATTPKGTPSGGPVVSGAGQTGYNLVTRGWTINRTNLLMYGDFLQVGYRLYKVMDNVNSDGSGNATIHLWPNLRDQPVDGLALVTSNCKGLFRLKNNSGNKWSTNAGNYGMSGFAIREAI